MAVATPTPASNIAVSHRATGSTVEKRWSQRPSEPLAASKSSPVKGTSTNKAISPAESSQPLAENQVGRAAFGRAKAAARKEGANGAPSTSSVVIPELVEHLACLLAMADDHQQRVVIDLRLAEGGNDRINRSAGLVWIFVIGLGIDLLG